MKKISLILLVVVFVSSCKNESKTIENDSQIGADDLELSPIQDDGLHILKGDFLYLADAAVLQTANEIYGVIINDKMHELNTMVQAYKTEETDMVPVEIRAKIVPKPEGEEGWDFKVEIKEILNVTEPNLENGSVIKIGN